MASEIEFKENIEEMALHRSGEFLAVASGNELSVWHIQAPAEESRQQVPIKTKKHEFTLEASNRPKSLHFSLIEKVSSNRPSISVSKTNEIMSQSERIIQPYLAALTDKGVLWFDLN